MLQTVPSSFVFHFSETEWKFKKPKDSQRNLLQIQKLCVFWALDIVRALVVRGVSTRGVSRGSLRPNILELQSQDDR